MTKKIRLPDVTLLAATSIEIDDALAALTISSAEIEFAAVKWVPLDRPAQLPADFDLFPSRPWTFWVIAVSCSRTCTGISTPRICLVVQSDGFVVNANFWRDEFLQYDYIGAPWPERILVNPDNRILQLNRNRVGNGGFSLRSHRLVECSAQIDFDALDEPLKSEDLVICHFLLPEALKRLPAKAFAPYRAPSARRAPAAQSKPGRNDRCPCGSGRKFKRCHGG